MKGKLRLYGLSSVMVLMALAGSAAGETTPSSVRVRLEGATLVAKYRFDLPLVLAEAPAPPGARVDASSAWLLKGLYGALTGPLGVRADDELLEPRIEGVRLEPSSASDLAKSQDERGVLVFVRYVFPPTTETLRFRWAWGHRPKAVRLEGPDGPIELPYSSSQGVAAYTLSSRPVPAWSWALLFVGMAVLLAVIAGRLQSKTTAPPKR